MKKIDLKGIDQSLYYDELSNGLKVYLLPFVNKNNYFVSYFTRFGSLQLDFYSKSDNKYVHVPEGIAHFLEHKMFEQKDGVDPFTFFAKSGANCNASTGYKTTRYYFSGNDKLIDNLNFLIDYVNDPYFTDENVEKEKGIICEEINMYKDDPEWYSSEVLQTMLFHNHTARIPIAGSCESVCSMTKEDLYRTYETFYNPNNMYLIVAGELDPEVTLEVIKNNQKLNNINKQPLPKLKKIIEPLNVKEKYKVLELENVTTTKLGYSLKLDKNIFALQDSFELSLYIGMILNILYGSTSIFRDQMMEQNKLSSIYFDRTFFDDFLIIDFWIETDVPDEMITLIQKHFTEYQITEEEVNRIQKVWLASEIMMSDNVESMVSSLSNDIIEYNNIITNRTEYIKNLNYKQLLRIKNKIDFSNTSTLIVKKKS